MRCRRRWIALAMQSLISCEKNNVEKSRLLLDVLCALVWTTYQNIGVKYNWESTKMV